MLGDFASEQGLSPSEIGRFNLLHPLLATGSVQPLVARTHERGALSFGVVQPAAGRTLAQVAALFGTLSAGQLVQANAAMWRTLTPGKSIQLNGATVVTTASDTFAHVWTASGGRQSARLCRACRRDRCGRRAA